MDKEQFKSIIDNTDAERKAEYIAGLQKAEYQTAINLSNDRRIISIYPLLLQARQTNLNMIIQDKQIILNSLNSVLNSLGNAFNIVAVDPLSNGERLIFFALVITDIMIKETYLMLKFDEAETKLTNELNKPLINYYENLPKIII